jgi:hypothetical protein
VSRRWTTWLALGLWLLTLALLVATGVMRGLGWHGVDTTSGSGLLALSVAYLAFATMGALVAAHVPQNPLGWMFLAIALAAAANTVVAHIAYRGLVDDPGSIRGALAAAWYYEWAWLPTLGLAGFVLLLYPTGGVPGPRWRIVLWGLVVLFSLVTLAAMVNPGPLDGEESKLPDNPLGVELFRDAFSGAVVGVSLLLLVAAGVSSLVVRFRRSRGDERQQLKWMMFAGLLVVVAALVTGLAGIEDSAAGDIVFSISIIQLPIAVGIALFRYRLYDIDRVISGTLVYALLTVILGVVYVGLVLAGQAVFSSFAGGSNLAIAVSTLVVAALSLPVRSRVQALVDRRFYRRRYDAQRTLEEFGARARRTVDLETLAEDLRVVVDETMQPAHVSLSLCGERR